MEEDARERDARLVRRAVPWDHPGLRFASAVGAFCLGGLIYSLVLGEAPRYPDEADYLALGRNLLGGAGYSLDGAAPYFERSPGYAWLIAPLLGLIDSVHVVRVAQFAALGLCAALLGDIAARAGGALGATLDRRDIGCLALGAVLAYPVLVYAAGTLFPQTFLALALVGVLWTLEVPATGARTAFLAGALAGLAVELSPNALTVLPLAALHLALSRRWPCRHLVPLLAGAVLVVGVWTLRNFLHHGEIVPFATNLSDNLRNAFAHAAALDGAGWQASLRDFTGAGDRLSQLLSAPTLYLANLVDFFGWRLELAVSGEATAARETVLRVTYQLLLVLVALRLALVPLARLGDAERTILLLYVATACFHALVFARLRWRLPFDLLLLLPALEAVMLLATRQTIRPWRKAGDGRAAPHGGTGG